MKQERTEATMQNEKNQNHDLIETEDGSLVRVPEDKLEAWGEADHKAPLSKAEQQFKDRILRELYSSKR